MPTASNRGVALHYETLGEGSGTAGESDVVAFVPDLGCGAWLWGWQAPALAGGFECVVFDPRGTGRSDAAGDYSIDALAADLEAVLSDHGERSATVVGAGLGGIVALAFAREYGRAERLALLGTAADGSRGDWSPFLGVPGDLEGLLSDGFRRELPDEVERIAEWREAEDAPVDARRALIDAASSFDASDWLHEVTQPALVLQGESDEVVPPEAGRGLADGLPRGRLETFEAGSHWFFVEQARLATDALHGFLEAGGAP